LIVVHKIALDPTKEQETSSRKAAGCARFASNWALAEWREQYEAGGKPSECSLRRLLNAIKAETSPWLLEVSKAVIQQAIKNLGAAFSPFFRRLEEYRHEPDPCRKKRLARKLGYPKFQKKGRCRDAFRADNGPATTGADAVRVDGLDVILPRIGRIRMRERLMPRRWSPTRTARSRCSRRRSPGVGNRSPHTKRSVASTWPWLRPSNPCWRNRDRPKS
jgi:putative transposase